jgi:hypothetical protein
MWRFKEEEEKGDEEEEEEDDDDDDDDDDDGISMAAAGFILLASKISKELKSKRHFGVRSKLSKRKILIYIFLPFSTFELLSPCPQRTAKGPHRAETSMQVVSDTCNKAESV